MDIQGPDIQGMEIRGMKVLYHPATTAFGATTIFLLILLAPLASFTHAELYHLSGPVSVVLLPVLFNFAAVWLLLTLLLVWGRRHRGVNTGIWTMLAITLPWMLMKAWFALRAPPMPRIANLVFLVSVLVVLVLVAAMLLAFHAPTVKLLLHARRLTATLLGFVALSGVAMLAEALYFGWQARELNMPRVLHQPLSAIPAKGTGHIIWIVLDELSYRQLYEHRYPGLKLAAFDRLAAGATVFTHVRPIGISTELVLPSLITGIPVDKVSAPAAGWPMHLRNASTQAWQQLDPRDTVFQDALNAGDSTAVAGWYNPYCRILPEVLDHCFWTSHVSLPGGMFPGQTMSWNSEQPVWHHLVSFAGRMHMATPLAGNPKEAIFHQQDYRELLAAGDGLLNDPSVDFLLLHMPIPHPDGIYNRHTARLDAAHTTYLDNLELCDVYLAHVRQELERKGSWDNATVVLMGDHSWRVDITWAHLPEWTPEEQAASNGGKFDDRPAYIVKLPGQHTAARIDTPFAALRTRELLDQLLAGRIRSPEQLAGWAQGN